MQDRTLTIARRPERVLKDDKRAVLRYLDLRDPARVVRVIKRISRLDDQQVARLLAEVVEHFGTRHRGVEEMLRYSHDQAVRFLRSPITMDDERKLLLGAYFTQEYSIEAAALFNPSIVPHPDQTGLAAGAVRFLMSLRATGEGHVSSIVFRRGIIGRAGGIEFDPPPSFAFTARPIYPPTLSKNDYRRCLCTIGLEADPTARVLEGLPDEFTHEQLRVRVREMRRSPDVPRPLRDALGRIAWPSRACYELRFPPEAHPAETVVFPATDYERQGMEDVRLVRFVDDDGEARHFGTYTASDGRRIYPMMLETRCFSHFRMGLLGGPYARNKGMALFPRRVGGEYLMVSRHDGENLFLLRSDNLHCWRHAQKLQTPTEPWELLLIGNCGSPIETEAGWILLTHGVGPMRQYCISASLLDLEDPSRVIGRLHEPLITPSGEEREGYVPNVVYSCGSMVHNGQLVIPYAVADSRVAFATVPLEDLLERLTAS